MHVLAPAKINLHLRVGKRRDDGFHPLVSWMCTVGLFDSLRFEISGTAPRELTLQCDRPDIPCGAENLVCKAAAALFAQRPEPLEIEAFLKKSIPSGAGLGGGSSDAARTLLALNDLCNVGAPMPSLSALAAKIGSDVPFFLYGPSAICRGRGERVEKVPPPKVRWALLILPRIHCPTPRIYQQFDAMGLGDESAMADIPWRDWSNLSSLELLPRLVNDLEPPAFALFPELAAMRGQLEQTLCRPVRMSGSGSSLFTLFDDEGECDIARRLALPLQQAEIFSVPVCPPLLDDLA